MRCMSEFTDFFACSTKLVHFIPYKQQKAFSPPTAVLFHESQCLVVSAIGRTIIKYDLATGNFLGYFSDISNSDITAMCEDGNRGRRLLIGNDQGRYYLINFTDGNVIDELKVHTKGIVNEMKIHTMEVSQSVNDHQLLSCSYPILLLFFSYSYPFILPLLVLLILVLCAYTNTHHDFLVHPSPNITGNFLALSSGWRSNHDLFQFCGR